MAAEQGTHPHRVQPRLLDLPQSWPCGWPRRTLVEIRALAARLAVDLPARTTAGCVAGESSGGLLGALRSGALKNSCTLKIEPRPVRRKESAGATRSCKIFALLCVNVTTMKTEEVCVSAAFCSPFLRASIHSACHAGGPSYKLRSRSDNCSRKINAFRSARRATGHACMRARMKRRSVAGHAFSCVRR